MPTYDYFCERCENEKEFVHSINDTPEIICDCGNAMKKMISRNVNFILKGSGWTGKDFKEKNYRLKRRQEVGKKMVMNHDLPQLQPNYKGEVCKSWDEAKKLAVSDGVDSLKYEKQVETLKGKEKELHEKRNKLLKGEG